MVMDVVMKLDFDNLGDDGHLADMTKQTPIYESEIILKMSGVLFDELTDYQHVKSSTLLCSSPLQIKGNNMSPQISPCPRPTSPYKKVCALRLFSSPATPKTLLEKCAADSISGAIRNRSRISRSRKKSPYTFNKGGQSEASNINPFTPTSIYLKKKRNTRRELEKNFNTSETPLITDSILNRRSFEDCSAIVESSFEEDELRQVKRLSLQEANVTRYRQEFLEFSLLGKGNFGGVYKCKHRLDGCIYAIKKSLNPIAGSQQERTALNEVYAHAVLGKHPHVVRYYSAWSEESHMIIQNEYCNGGSLSNLIRQKRQNKSSFRESELKRMLLHIARGLKYIHLQQLVHMDIKPDNIFIVKEPKLNKKNEESTDDGFDDENEDMSSDEEIIYKIGDLGHVTSIINPQVEEGDCRYMPREILQEKYNNLQRSDIFALGLTIYEAACGKPLPLNGEEWQSLRDGNLEELQNIGSDFQNILKIMTHSDPSERPTSAQVVQQLSAISTVRKSHQLLRRELQAEKIKNEVLSKQLNEATKCLKSIRNSPTLSLNAAIASGVLAGVSRSPAGSYNCRSRNTRSFCRRYKMKSNH